MRLVLVLLGIVLGVVAPAGEVRGAELAECAGTGSYDGRDNAGWVILADPSVDDEYTHGSHPFLKPPARIVFSTPGRVEGLVGPFDHVTEVEYFDAALKLAFRPDNGDFASVLVTITDTETTCVIHPRDESMPPTDAESPKSGDASRTGMAPLLVVALALLGSAAWSRRTIPTGGRRGGQRDRR